MFHYRFNAISDVQGNTPSGNETSTTTKLTEFWHHP